ncbi:MAG: hypothetical protein OEX98_07970 [Nitrosopumilus sp.]|nr:hypothetical protein [Nitrosopumilus sp.]
MDAKIINYLAAQNTFQKNAVATKRLTDLKNYYFLLGPDLS